MTHNAIYLCEKPDQGRIIARALGGGDKTQGGISGPGWTVTWGFGHLLTPYLPQDYNEEHKRWEWDPLPIVPQKFLFKAKDSMSQRQIGAIRKHFRNASEVIISTDADREGELIAYEILNEIGWKGNTKRLWLSDLTIPAVQKALSSLRDARETRPLYMAAAARTYADWIVGMNLSRAATLKLAARGGKPMSVGRVQTPVLGMIVDLERKIVNFKPEDYYEIKARVSSGNGDLIMRYAPPPEKREKDIQKAQVLRDRAQGARGPLSVKTEAKKQAPPPLLDLNALQQEGNSRFGWSADKSLKILQSLYEQHQILTYPRTDSSALPEDHKTNIPTISANVINLEELKHLADALSHPVERGTVYNDKKVSAHHAIIPTSKAPDMPSLDQDQKKLYLLVSRFWAAAHMPDMEYLQTTVTLDANGVPLRASGRQITLPGWKTAFQSASGNDIEDSETNEDDESEAPDQKRLPPLKDGENGLVRNAEIDAKKTKAPSRYNEKSLLQAMKNIASHVDDPEARKILKATSGIGTPATRANVIETLKSREYITIKKRQIIPTETAYKLIDAMKMTAPSYVDPIMTARWEDVLETIASGQDPGLTKRFVDGIAKTVRKDISELKSASFTRMEASGGNRRSKGHEAGHIEGDWKAAIANGTPLKVPFDKREKAKKLGARWNADKKTWVAPDGKDTDPFKQAGFL